MILAKQIALVVLGAIMAAVFVLIWAYGTRAITLFVENAWCSYVAAGECRFRGYQHFLIWTVIGVITLVVLGLLSDRVIDRFRD